MIKTVIFDFDGVLVESADIKTTAFAKLFEGQPEGVIRKIVEYHLNNTGISRYKKFEYFYSHILNQPLDEGSLQRLGDRFSSLVLEAVINAPWVAGARETLNSLCREVPLYVASGTPQDELRDIVSARKMDKYFKGVFGSPDTKSFIIKKVMEREGAAPREVVMVGDAMSDYRAAMETGVYFVGRATDGFNGFDGLNVITVKDLTGFGAVISRVGEGQMRQGTA